MNICSCMSKITVIIFIKTRSVLMKSLIDRYVHYVALSWFMHKVHLHIQTTVQHSKKLSYQNPTGLKYKQLVSFKVEKKNSKASLDSIPSPSPSVKIQTMGGKVGLRNKGKTLQVVVNKLLKTKSLLTSPSNVLPYYLK